MEFYRNILIPSIEGLPIESKTRSNNLVTTFLHSNTIPVYFRIYEDDLPTLSNHVASDHNTPYHYFFLYFKYGQMKTIIPPLSLHSLNLDTVVADPSHILGASIHVALNFSHNNRTFSVFWS